MGQPLKFLLVALLVHLNVYALRADDGKYLHYQQLLKHNNDTIKCCLLMAYAGTLMDSLQDYNFALFIYAKAATLLTNTEAPLLRIKLYAGRGYALYQQGHYNEADKMYLQALSDRAVNGQPALKAGILNKAAVNLQHMLVSKRALTYYNEALEIYTRLNDIKNIGAVYMNMASIYVVAGKYAQAEQFVNTAIQLFLKHNLLEDYGLILANKAYIKSKTGQADSAIILLVRASMLPIKTQLKKAGAYVKLYGNLGSFYAQTGRFDSCFYYINKGKHLADSMGLSAQFDGTYYNFMGYCYDLQHNFKKAVYNYKMALKIKTGIPGYKLLYDDIADLYFEHKLYDSAFFYKNEFIRISDSIYKSELKELTGFENKRLELLEKDRQDQEAMQQLEKKNYLLLSSILLLIVCALVCFILFHRYRFKIKKEHLQGELDFLKAQLNPHFLFNSLNNIYVLLDENPEKAAGILLKFSELMRYQLYECNVSSISLHKELQFLENYMAFEKLRYSNRIDVSYQMATGTNGFHLAPLLLQPFIENAFKHTPRKKGRQSRIEVTASVNGSELLFQVNNPVDASKKVSGLPGGIGLNNVKKRLKLLYPGKHALAITKTEQAYKIVLRLTLAHDELRDN